MLARHGVQLADFFRPPDNQNLIAKPVSFGNRE
jgi:hypothetical protein